MRLRLPERTLTDVTDYRSKLGEVMGRITRLAHEVEPNGGATEEARRLHAAVLDAFTALSAAGPFTPPDVRATATRVANGFQDSVGEVVRWAVFQPGRSAPQRAGRPTWRCGLSLRSGRARSASGSRSAWRSTRTRYSGSRMAERLRDTWARQRACRDGRGRQAPCSVERDLQAASTAVWRSPPTPSTANTSFRRRSATGGSRRPPRRLAQRLKGRGTCSRPRGISRAWRALAYTTRMHVGSYAAVTSMPCSTKCTARTPRPRK